MIPRTASTPVLEVAVRTDRGLKRAQNEDGLLAADPCFLVADGMGGYEAGDEAARAAIAAFSEEFTAPVPATLERIEAALDRARREVAAIAAVKPRGAGCTLTGVVRIEHEGRPFWYVLNVGDSRVYLLRGGAFEQLTRDHSLRAALQQAGGGAAAALAPRNVITRALGSDDDRHDAWLLPVESGTRLLICSDGLTSELSDDELVGVLGGGGRPADVCDDLLRRALAAGGRDNITLIVADVVSGAPAPEPVGATGASAGTTADDVFDGTIGTATGAIVDATIDDTIDDTIERTRPRWRR